MKTNLKYNIGANDPPKEQFKDHQSQLN